MLQDGKRRSWEERCLGRGNLAMPANPCEVGTDGGRRRRGRTTALRSADRHNYDECGLESPIALFLCRTRSGEVPQAQRQVPRRLALRSPPRNSARLFAILGNDSRKLPFIEHHIVRSKGQPSATVNRRQECSSRLHCLVDDA